MPADNGWWNANGPGTIQHNQMASLNGCQQTRLNPRRIWVQKGDLSLGKGMQNMNDEWHN
jgi:hypothetical protein